MWCVILNFILILKTSFSALDETLTVTKDDVTSWSVPHLITYVNGERLEVNYPEAPEKDIEQEKDDPDPQDDVFDVPNIWTNTTSDTEYLLYDFKNRRRHLKHCSTATSTPPQLRCISTHVTTQQ